MDMVGMLVNAVSGAVGGNISGAALKQMSLGTIGNTIAGAVGGVAGTYIAQAMGILASMGLADMTVASIGTEAGISAVCGAVVTVIVGFVKNKMAK